MSSLALSFEAIWHIGLLKEINTTAICNVKKKAYTMRGTFIETNETVCIVNIVLIHTYCCTYDIVHVCILCQDNVVMLVQEVAFTSN